MKNKLKVAPGQRISRMSCGQRSQVALGLILAQNPELLVLDDFSLGLDPGYRRLFVDYLRDYARSEGKTSASEVSDAIKITLSSSMFSGIEATW